MYGAHNIAFAAEFDDVDFLFVPDIRDIPNR
jgi:hypothetical protein